jgi:uncharacterized membrane protein
MNSNSPINNSICIAKFKTLSLTENGLILKNKNKEEKNVLFSEVHKIYIKKCKFSLLNRIVSLSILLVFVSISAKYLPVGIVLLASIILFTVLLVKMYTCKWYQLHLYLIDGTSHYKVFYSSKKQNYINLVNAVRKGYFDCRLKSNFQFDTPKEGKTLEHEFLFSGFNIV